MRLPKFFSSEPRVEFCDGCGRIYTSHCDAERARDRAIEQAIAGRFGIS
jgi:hypothetical protein